MIAAAWVAAIVSISFPGQRALSGIFAALFSFNGYWLGAFAGTESIFAASIIAEVAIALAVVKFQHRAAEWIVIASALLVVAHLLSWIGFKTDVFEIAYQMHEITIPVIEAGQILGIIVASDPVFNRIAALSRKKQGRREMWLATISAQQ
jgi:hypothetical protein